MEEWKMKKYKLLSILIIIAVVFTIASLANAGQLTPSAPPAPTMHTMEEMYQKLNALEQKVSVLYDNNVTFKPWASNTRYKIFDNGTLSDPNDDMVLDTQTGLIWARNANLPNGTKNWQDAMAYCANLVLAGKDDWRLPSLDELLTLLDKPYPNATNHPDLPTGNPFINVQTTDQFYWTSTVAGDGAHRIVSIDTGYHGAFGMDSYSGSFVWPVRGPQ
jgi:hypothetical protein